MADKVERENLLTFIKDAAPFMIKSVRELQIKCSVWLKKFDVIRVEDRQSHCKWEDFR